MILCFMMAASHEAGPEHQLGCGYGSSATDLVHVSYVAVMGHQLLNWLGSLLVTMLLQISYRAVKLTSRKAGWGRQLRSCLVCQLPSWHGSSATKLLGVMGHGAAVAHRRLSPSDCGSLAYRSPLADPSWAPLGMPALPPLSEGGNWRAPAANQLGSVDEDRSWHNPVWVRGGRGSSRARPSPARPRLSAAQLAVGLAQTGRGGMEACRIMLLVWSHTS